MSGPTIGAIVLATFAAVWMLSAAAVLKRINVRTTIGVITVSGAVCFLAIVQPHTAHLGPTIAAQHPHTNLGSGPGFWVVLGIEWFAIVAAVVILRLAKRADLIFATIALIVGIHFVPLANVFGTPLYYFTAAAMIVPAVISFRMKDRLRAKAVVCVSCGLVLWVTAIVLLTLAPR